MAGGRGDLMTVSAQDGAGNFLVLHDYLPLLIVEEKNDGSDGGESDGGDNDPNVSGTLESTLSPHEYYRQSGSPSVSSLF